VRIINKKGALLDKVIVKLKEIIAKNIAPQLDELTLSLNYNESEIHLLDCKNKNGNLIKKELYFYEFENKKINKCCIKEVSDFYSSFVDKTISSALYMIDNIDLLSKSLSINNNFMNGDIFTNINSDIDDLDLALSKITINYLYLSGDVKFYNMYHNIINKVEQHIIDKYKSDISVKVIKNLTKNLHSQADTLIKTSIFDSNIGPDQEIDSSNYGSFADIDSSLAKLGDEDLKIRETLIKLFIGRKYNYRMIVYIPLWVYEVLKEIDSTYLGSCYKLYGEEVDKAAEVLFNEAVKGDPCFNYDTAYKTASMLDR
jgi:hypothetical protein